MTGASHVRHAGGVGRLRGRLASSLPLLGMVVGVCMLVMPIVLDLAGCLEAGRTVSSMTDRTDGMGEAERSRWLAQAKAYNHVLADEETSIGVKDILPYAQQLGGAGEAVVSWVEVPKASIRMPVRLGTSDAVLASGAGHLEGSSLPVGGASTHAVLMGHSGMYGSRMFDDIRELEQGDLFALHTMGEELTYEVEDVRVVLPEEVSALGVETGEDLCTLVTCTPYGVNDHRLLVTGRRTSRGIGKTSPGQEAAGYVTKPRVAPLLAGIAVLLAALVGVRRARRRRLAGEGTRDGRGPGWGAAGGGGRASARPNARHRRSGAPPGRRRPAGRPWRRS